MTAARLAASIARTSGASLCLFNVVPNPEHARLPAHLRQAQLSSTTHESGERLGQLRAELADLTAGEVAIETLTRADEPSNAILHYAREWNAQLLVMGSLGKALRERHGLGSIAARVARGAFAPVLVVRQEHRERLPAGGLFHQPLVAIDYSRFVVPAIKAAAALTEADRTIELLHVFHAPGDWQKQSDLSEALLEARTEELQRLEELARQVDAIPLAVHVRSEGEEVADQILDYIEQSRSDLLVLGAHSRDKSIAILGTVADRILRTSKAPVLIIPDRALA